MIAAASDEQKNSPALAPTLVNSEYGAPYTGRILGRIVTLEGPSMRTRHIDPVPGRLNQEIAS